MSTKHDYYELLGLQKTATRQEIEQAYRKLAVEYHPDRCAPEKKDEAREKFKEMSEAYAVLSDAEKKKQYDQFGHAGIDGRYTDEDIFRGADFSSIFQNMGFEGGSGEDNIFDVLFGGGRGSRRSGGQRRGSDLEYQVSLTLEEAFKGTEKKIEYYHTKVCPVCSGNGMKPGSGKKTCPQCRGTGQQTSAFGGFFAFSQPCQKCGGRGEIIEVPCRECKGRGKVKESSQLTVKIPPGVDNGTSIRIRSRGEAGELGGPPGDLYVVTRVLIHNTFSRRGSDLHTEKKVSYPVACLGGELNIRTLDGNVAMKIPAGTQSNKLFRLKEKGMPDLHTGRPGDLYVQVNIDVPSKLSSKQKDLISELGRNLPEPDK